VGYIARWYTRPKTVTHRSINRARRALTSLMRRTALLTTPRRAWVAYLVRFSSIILVCSRLSWFLMSAMSCLQRSISDILCSSTEIQATNYRQHRISNTQSRSACVSTTDELKRCSAAKLTEQIDIFVHLQRDCWQPCLSFLWVVKWRYSKA